MIRNAQSAGISAVLEGWEEMDRWFAEQVKNGSLTINDQIFSLYRDGEAVKSFSKQEIELLADLALLALGELARRLVRKGGGA